MVDDHKTKFLIYFYWNFFLNIFGHETHSQVLVVNSIKPDLTGSTVTVIILPTQNKISGDLIRIFIIKKTPSLSVDEVIC